MVGYHDSTKVQIYFFFSSIYSPIKLNMSIYKATYSSVPVYELICKDITVMKRKTDSYLNATQILKVAGFDKPQRTRILEKEIQTGHHEKVQGGYGKYQGNNISSQAKKYTFHLPILFLRDLGAI